MTSDAKDEIIMMLKKEQDKAKNENGLLKKQLIDYKKGNAG